MNNTTVGVDLAKDVIQVCIVKDNKVVSNEEVTPVQFTGVWYSKPSNIPVWDRMGAYGNVV